MGKPNEKSKGLDSLVDKAIDYAKKVGKAAVITTTIAAATVTPSCRLGDWPKHIGGEKPGVQSQYRLKVLEAYIKFHTQFGQDFDPAKTEIRAAYASPENPKDTVYVIQHPKLLEEYWIVYGDSSKAPEQQLP